MFHVDNNSGVSSMPPAGAVQSSAPRWFTEGGGGTPASYPGAAWFNIVQAELLNVLSAYGVAPDKADLTQLKKAIEEAIRQKATAASTLLAAIAALNTSANKLPYFNGKDTVAMTDLTAFARTLLGRTDAASILSDLGLSAFISHPSSEPGGFTQVNSPDGGVYLFIANNNSWGAQKADGTSIPLPLERGGSGSGTAAGARTAFGLGDSATKNVGTTAGTVAAGNDSRLVNLKSAANRDVGTSANQIPDMSFFPSGSGWEKLPNGKIRQWGTLTTSTTTTKSTNFPIAFPNVCQSLVGTMRDVTQAGAYSLGSASSTAFQANSWSLVDTTTGAVRSSTEIAWVAIGE